MIVVDGINTVQLLFQACTINCNQKYESGHHWSQQLSLIYFILSYCERKFSSFVSDKVGCYQYLKISCKHGRILSAGKSLSVVHRIQNVF